MAPPYRPRNLPVQSAARQPGLRWLRMPRPAGLRTRSGQSACKSETFRKLVGGETPPVQNRPLPAGALYDRPAVPWRFLTSCCLSAHSYRAQAPPCHRTHLRTARRVWRTVVRATHTPLILVLPRPHPTATCVTISSGGASGAGVMPCAEVAIVKAKPAIAINLSIVLLPALFSSHGLYSRPEAVFQPPRPDLRCLLADVHQAVVKLDHGTGRALDGVAGCVAIPPTVAVPGATRVIGAHCVVRAAFRDACGVATHVGCAGSPNRITVVRTARVLPGPAIVSRTGTGSGRGADCSAPVLPARDAGNANGSKRATDPCFSALDR